MRPLPEPALRFTPSAWAKLLYFRDRADTEIGGLGLVPDPSSLLVTEFLTLKQEVTGASVAFEDAALSDLFENLVDRGYKPHQFARVWLHTHPGSSATPSCVDEETFDRVFGGCDWAVMFILAKGGQSYARLRFGAGPGGQIELGVKVDFTEPFTASDRDTWEAEYLANVRPRKFDLSLAGNLMPDSFSEWLDHYDLSLEAEAWLVEEERQERGGGESFDPDDVLHHRS